MAHLVGVDVVGPDGVGDVAVAVLADDKRGVVLYDSTHPKMSDVPHASHCTSWERVSEHWPDVLRASSERCQNRRTIAQV